MPSRIGTLAEKSLHAALKLHYAQPGDAVEAKLDGYVIDIVRALPSGALADDGESSRRQCIEIQTRNLGGMKTKLTALLDKHRVHVVHPIAQERIIVRIDANGEVVSRRKSPKKGSVYQIFPELVSLPALVTHPNLTLEVLLMREEQVWIDNGQGSWRRKHWSISDRRLLGVVHSHPLASIADFMALLPPDLPDVFDSNELAKGIRQQRFIAQKMAYCLREMGILEIEGKRRNAILYRVRPPV